MKYVYYVFKPGMFSASAMFLELLLYKYGWILLKALIILLKG